MPERKSLLAIIELGGYPNLMPVYQRLGFDADLVTTQRKAKAWLKKKQPDVIVAEYNFQTDFRDRSSNLEPWLRCCSGIPESGCWCFIPPSMKPASGSAGSTMRCGKPFPFRSRNRR
ncbi:hypothetical protein [Thiolapillus sp.]|uniref:hypothetical protein n=1 Tax=Thiolapillus sp. TaxID=2017437 RepID=UPI0025EA9817|nr:hypothetical protein [Thiolapillus sp.]